MRLHIFSEHPERFDDKKEIPAKFESLEARNQTEEVPIEVAEVVEVDPILRISTEVISLISPLSGIDRDMVLDQVYLDPMFQSTSSVVIPPLNLTVVPSDKVISLLIAEGDHYGLSVLGLLRYFLTFGADAYKSKYCLTMDEDACSHVSYHLFQTPNLWAEDVRGELNGVKHTYLKKIYKLVPVDNDGGGLCFFYALLVYGDVLLDTDSGSVTANKDLAIVLRQKLFDHLKFIIGKVLPRFISSTILRLDKLYNTLTTQEKLQCEASYQEIIVEHTFLVMCGVESFELLVKMYCEDYYPKSTGTYARRDISNSLRCCCLVEEWQKSEGRKVRVVMFSFNSDGLKLYYRRLDGKCEEHEVVGDVHEAGDVITCYLCYNGINDADGHYWGMRIATQDQDGKYVDELSLTNPLLPFWHSKKYDKCVRQSRRSSGGSKSIIIKTT